MQKENFTLKTQDRQANSVTLKSDDFIDFKVPDAQKLDTTYIVILLDMSGSMSKNSKGDNTQKLAGATAAIEKFLDSAKQQNLDIKISLVPFGYAGNIPCNHLYEVNQDNIATDYPFVELNNSELNTKLSEYKSVNVCAATDIHQPLIAASQHLRAKFKEHTQQKPQEIPPRLVTILLSDGFDTKSNQETEQMKEVLLQSPKINVHTLGYGESLKELKNRAICNRNIPDAKLTPQNVIANCRLSKGNINEFAIDEPKLKDIAQSTGGTYQISSNADIVAQNLIKVLKTLREYQITYQQPGATAAGTYQTTVEVSNSSLEDDISTTEAIYLNYLVYDPLPLTERLIILFLILLLGSSGIISWRMWSQKLKSQAEALS
ncbi:MAG: VWA domain-containing protein [Richelia sp. RM2_1_2]|nr:VWA domain-containing protein [Richelia sp. RM2_1_2]